MASPAVIGRVRAALADWVVELALDLDLNPTEAGAHIALALEAGAAAAGDPSNDEPFDHVDARTLLEAVRAELDQIIVLLGGRSLR